MYYNITVLKTTHLFTLTQIRFLEMLFAEAPWTAPFLFFIMMTVSLGVMNLILAVIVERAAEARANDQDVAEGDGWDMSNGKNGWLIAWVCMEILRK